MSGKQTQRFRYTPRPPAASAKSTAACAPRRKLKNSRFMSLTECHSCQAFCTRPRPNQASSITYTGSEQPLLTRDKQGKGLRHNVAETPSLPSSPITRSHPLLRIFYPQSFTSLPISPTSPFHPHLSTFPFSPPQLRLLAGSQPFPIAS